MQRKKKKKTLRSGPQPPRVLSKKETRRDGEETVGGPFVWSLLGCVMWPTDWARAYSYSHGHLNPLDPHPEVHSGALGLMKSHRTPFLP